MVLKMANLVVFLNSFLSYLVLLVIILIVAGVAVTIGLTLAKRKNAKAAVESAAAQEEKV